jgi:hypothetical protein
LLFIYLYLPSRSLIWIIAAMTSALSRQLLHCGNMSNFDHNHAALTPIGDKLGCNPFV